MPLSIGTRLGLYEITDLLGTGGMGEVYRARDSKLRRDVAIKVLPASLANDAGRMARFQREARVLASLNHPNIAAVYGLEENAIVMELVEGSDLRGPLPLEEALKIARQIVEALEAAHEKGIVHRDLKPANIKIRADGVAKVLDFGIAKAVERTPVPGDPGDGPTLTIGTEVGTVVGTAAYMAPEQARGQPVDHRADIWAFGVVLYEMLTGKRTFKGDSISDTLAAVLTKEPDWSALPAATPPRVRELLRLCLAKDQKLRLQAIGDARIFLDAPAEDTVRLAAAPRRQVLPWAVAGLLALIAAISWWAPWRRPRPRRIVRSYRWIWRLVPTKFAAGDLARWHAHCFRFKGLLSHPAPRPGKDHSTRRDRGRLLPLLFAERTVGRFLRQPEAPKSCRGRRRSHHAVRCPEPWRRDVG